MYINKNMKKRASVALNIHVQQILASFKTELSVHTRHTLLIDQIEKLRARAFALSQPTQLNIKLTKYKCRSSKYLYDGNSRT